MGDCGSDATRESDLEQESGEVGGDIVVGVTGSDTMCSITTSVSGSDNRHPIARLTVVAPRSCAKYFLRSCIRHATGDIHSCDLISVLSAYVYGGNNISILLFTSSMLSISSNTLGVLVMRIVDMSIICKFHVSIYTASSPTLGLHPTCASNTVGVFETYW